MSIEAGGINGWWKYAHAPFGMETFGYAHTYTNTRTQFFHFLTPVLFIVLFILPSLSSSTTRSLFYYNHFFIHPLLLTLHTLTISLVLHPSFLPLSVSAPAPSIYNLFGFSVPNLCVRAREVVAFYKEKGAPSLLKYPRFPKLGSLAGH